MPMTDLEEQISRMSSKEDFTAFLGALSQYFRQAPSEWENRTLKQYLEAMEGWTEDMEGYYANFGIPVPQAVNWQVFARILMAATMYE